VRDWKRVLEKKLPISEKEENDKKGHLVWEDQMGKSQ